MRTVSSILGAGALLYCAVAFAQEARPAWWSVNKPRISYPEQRVAVSHLAFSPDGKAMASAGHERMVKLWETSKEGEIAAIPGKNVISSMAAWSPDGKMLAIAGGTTDVHLQGGVVVDKSLGIIKLYDAESLKEKATLEIQDGGTKFVFAPDSKTLISGSGYRATFIILWDLASGKEKQRFDAKDTYVTTLAITRDGKVLASGHNNGWIHFWDLETGKETGKWEAHPQVRITSLDFAPDGKTLAASTTEAPPKYDPLDYYPYKCYDLAAAKEKPPIPYRMQSREERVNAVRIVRFSPDGKLLAVSSGAWVKCFDTSTGRLAGAIMGGEGEVIYLAFSPDGRLLATGSTYRTVKIWELPQSK